MPLCASAGITIKLDKNLPSGWGAPSIYAWNNGEFWSWANSPAMDDSGDGYYTYTFADDKTTVNIIFKDGNGNQTVDIENITEDSTFQITGSSNKYSYVLVGGPEREEKTYTVYFENTNNWGAVYAYVYGSLGTPNGGWPGATVPSKEINGKTYYYYELTTKESINGVYIIFNMGSNAGQTGNLDFVDNGIYNASSATGSDPIGSVGDEPVEPDVYTYAIRGNFTVDDKNDWFDYHLEGKGDELSVKITPKTGTSGNFGIRTLKNGVAQTDQWFGGNVSISESNSTATLSGSANSTWNLALNKEYTFTYNITTNELKIDWDRSGAVVKDPIYIFGQIDKGAWQTNVGYELKNIAGTDKYYCNNLKTIDSDGECGLTITTKLMSTADNWSIDNYRFSVVGGDASALGIFNIAKRTSSDDESFKIKSGTYYAIVDLAAMTLEIGDAAEHLKSINQPEALYMYGNFSNNHFEFDTDKPVVATPVYNTEDGTYEYKFEDVVIVTATEPLENGYFILVAGPRYEAPAEEIALFAEEPVSAPVTPAEVDWTKIADKNRYVLGENNVVTPLIANAHPTTADHCTAVQDGHIVNLTVKLAENGEHSYVLDTTGVATGVEAIEAEANAPVEYYNLQGVRVANPENGIFIRRQGNKVSKVAIR